MFYVLEGTCKTIQQLTRNFYLDIKVKITNFQVPQINSEGRKRKPEKLDGSNTIYEHSILKLDPGGLIFRFQNNFPFVSYVPLRYSEAAYNH